LFSFTHAIFLLQEFFYTTLHSQVVLSTASGELVSKAVLVAAGAVNSAEAANASGCVVM
jgi:hypothetical protein